MTTLLRAIGSRLTPSTPRIPVPCPPPPMSAIGELERHLMEIGRSTELLAASVATLRASAGAIAEAAARMDALR